MRRAVLFPKASPSIDALRQPLSAFPRTGSDELAAHGRAGAAELSSHRKRMASLVTLVAALLCVLAGPAWSQTIQARGVMPLGVGEGRLLRLDRDAANILIADPSVADVQAVSPRTVFVFGRKPGQTTLSATDAGSGTAAQLVLRVTRTAAAAQAALPPGSGTASLGFEGDRIVVRGPVGDLGQALDANATARAYNPSGLPPLDRTRLAGAQQVTLRVRIAEASRSTLSQLGVNLNVLANPGSFAFRLVTGSFVGGAAAGVGSLSTSLSGFGNGSTFGQAGAGVTTGRVNANALLNALQSEGLVTTLAEPNLTTISGETARFNAGGEVPIPVPQSFGVTTIQYKRYGVQLAFTPVLLPGGRIALRVQPEVSEISFANSISVNGTSVPSFVSRSAETNVEMASGQTLAIAGLFQRSEQTSLARFPFLGDIPVLGALFRSRSYQRDETELIILVTPYLSAPVSNSGAFPLPTDRVVPLPSGPLAGGGFVVD